MNDPDPRPASGRSSEPARPTRPYAISPATTLGNRPFRFPLSGRSHGLCAELRAKGVAFPVELKNGVNGSLLCYVAAPDGVSIELMQC